MSELLENEQNQENEYPDTKPAESSKKSKKLLVISTITLLGVLILWVMVSGNNNNHNAKKNGNSIDTVAIPEYEAGMKRTVSATNEIRESDENSSLLPSVNVNDVGLDPSQVQQPQGNLYYGNRGSSPSSSRQVSANSNSQYNSNYSNQQYTQPEPRSLVSSVATARLNSAYQAEVDHFKGTKKLAWQIDDASYDKLKTGDRISSVEPVLKDLYDGASSARVKFGFTIPSGTRIIATTDQAISTDHPGFFTSTVVRPFELKGSKLICQAGQNQNDRIPVQPTKLIFADKTEIAIQGQVEMGFPGLQGKVSNHWPQRVLPAIASAAVGGGAAAYLLSSSTPGASETNAGNISTRDLIAGPILESSVQQVQNEVTRFAKDLPNTVLVKAGEQFAILLTDKLTIKQ